MCRNGGSPGDWWSCLSGVGVRSCRPLSLGRRSTRCSWQVMRLGWRISRWRRRVRSGFRASHRRNYKGKRKGMNKDCRKRLDGGRRRRNEQTRVRWDERDGRRSPKLREGRKGENNPQRMHQTDNGWCESVKMQQISTEEVKGVPFDDRMSVED